MSEFEITPDVLRRERPVLSNSNTTHSEDAAAFHRLADRLEELERVGPKFKAGDRIIYKGVIQSVIGTHPVRCEIAPIWGTDIAEHKFVNADDLKFAPAEPTLVERLRNWTSSMEGLLDDDTDELTDKAADRIEELERLIERDCAEEVEEDLKKKGG